MKYNLILTHFSQKVYVEMYLKSKCTKKEIQEESWKRLEGRECRVVGLETVYHRIREELWCCMKVVKDMYESWKTVVRRGYRQVSPQRS